MKASARSAASYEDTRGKVDRRAAKIEPQTRPGNPRARWGANRLLACAQNIASSEGGDGSRSGLHGGRGHGLGARTHVAAALVEALAVEAEKAPKQVLRTFVALRNTSSSAQGKVDDGVQRARSAQERWWGRGNAGRRDRGQGRETSNRPNAESERCRDGGGRRSEDSWRCQRGSSCETCSLHSRTLRIMARTSVVAARMLANEERNRQLSRGGAAP